MRGRTFVNGCMWHVVIYGGFLKWGYPQIIHLNRIFHEINHPASLGYLHFRKPPSNLGNPWKLQVHGKHIQKKMEGPIAEKPRVYTKHMTGWWYTYPSEKYESQLGRLLGFQTTKQMRYGELRGYRLKGFKPKPEENLKDNYVRAQLWHTSRGHRHLERSHRLPLVCTMSRNRCPSPTCLVYCQSFCCGSHAYICMGRRCKWNKKQ